MAELQERRKRTLYRACHRGTKEMDWLLGRFAQAEVAAMGPAELDAFEALLALPDPQLESWIVRGVSTADNGVTALIERLRGFHGLSG